MASDVIVSCVQAETEKGEKAYRVAFAAVGEFVFTFDETMEHCLYEEGRTEDVGVLLTAVLTARMRKYIIPFCAYTKRTEKQISDRIKSAFCEKNGYGGAWSVYIDTAAEAVTDLLVSEGYAGDRKYCEAYIRSLGGKAVSGRLIERELEKRGIPSGIAAASVGEAGIDEDEMCARALEKKLRSRKNAADDDGVLSDKEKASLMRFLMSRGFDAGTAMRALRRYVPGADTE